MTLIDQNTDLHLRDDGAYDCDCRAIALIKGFNLNAMLDRLEG